jgi:hypothetical protein
VSEGQRIDIAVQLRDFQARMRAAGGKLCCACANRSCFAFLRSAACALQASAERNLVFPPGLSNDDRAVVHAECRKARRGARRAARQLRVCVRCAARCADAAAPTRAAGLREQEPRQGRHALRDRLQGAHAPRGCRRAHALHTT